MSILCQDLSSRRIIEKQSLVYLFTREITLLLYSLKLSIFRFSGIIYSSSSNNTKRAFFSVGDNIFKINVFISSRLFSKSNLLLCIYAAILSLFFTTKLLLLLLLLQLESKFSSLILESIFFSISRISLFKFSSSLLSIYLIKRNLLF